MKWTPGRVAGAVIGALLLAAVPWGLSVYRHYDAYADYFRATVVEASPRWAEEPLSPEACLDEGYRWIHGCPGIDDFCESGFRRVVSRCVASRDRTAWCRALNGRWAATTFGYQACEERVAAEDDPDLAETIDDACPLGYRVLADHCSRLMPAPR